MRGPHIKTKTRKMRKTVGQKKGTTRRHRRKKKKTGISPFVKLKCSPASDAVDDSTCYSDTDLLKLKHQWDEKFPKNPLHATTPKKILAELRMRHSSMCDKESCWIDRAVKSPELKKELLGVFAPKSPASWKKKPNEWLSTVDILSVMNQYEKKYRCFKFLGPSPIDFDFRETATKCVWKDLCDFSLKAQIAQSKTKLGIILNTDTHDGGGEHWISMFINIKKGRIFYFDSVGYPAPPEVHTFVGRIVKQGAELDKPIKFSFDQNHPVRHQYGTTECGIYSLYFIVHMLEDKITDHYLKTHIIKDSYVHQFRSVYFNSDL